MAQVTALGIMNKIKIPIYNQKYAGKYIRCNFCSDWTRRTCPVTRKIVNDQHINTLVIKKQCIICYNGGVKGKDGIKSLETNTNKSNCIALHCIALSFVKPVLWKKYGEIRHKFYFSHIWKHKGHLLIVEEKPSLSRFSLTRQALPFRWQRINQRPILHAASSQDNNGFAVQPFLSNSAYFYANILHCSIPFVLYDFGDTFENRHSWLPFVIIFI